MGADYHEFKHNIRQLPGGSKIRITRDDFEVITEQGKGTPEPSALLAVRDG